MNNIRIGIGFDVHPLQAERALILGGVEIPYDKGLYGHSDGDVLIHAIIDSLMGPSDLGDIGRLFPDSDPQYRDISSLVLLMRVGDLLKEKSIAITNIDTVILCEDPKIAPYVDRMKEKIAQSLGYTDTGIIGIKGKTTEKLGFTGRGEGIAAYAVSLINL